MAIEIKEIRSKNELKQFVLFPYQLYQNHPYWVPPLQQDELNTLRKEKNPAFAHSDARYWMAFKNGKPAGRIAGMVIHPAIEKWKKRQIRFGWFDFIDDTDISKCLLETVEAWGKELKMDTVHGPLGFTDLDYEGMLIEGFEEPGTLAALYNYAYYPQHMAKHGYNKDVDWVEYAITLPETIPEKVDRISRIVEKRLKLKLLRVKNAKGLLPYAKELFEILEESYSHLYGVAPLTEAQVDSYIKQYFGFIQPEFVSAVLDSSGRMVAFGVTMPSLTKALQKNRGKLWPFGFIPLLRAMKKNDRADLYLIGVRPELQGKGVNALMIRELHKVFQRKGIRYVESNPELESNSRVQSQWKYYPSRQHKRRRCFIKSL